MKNSGNSSVGNVAGGSVGNVTNGGNSVVIKNRPAAATASAGVTYAATSHLCQKARTYGLGFQVVAGGISGSYGAVDPDGACIFFFDADPRVKAVGIKTFLERDSDLKSSFGAVSARSAAGCGNDAFSLAGEGACTTTQVYRAAAHPRPRHVTHHRAPAAAPAPVAVPVCESVGSAPVCRPVR